MAVKILIDSASDIDLDEANELGVELIPMKITFEDGEYSDGVDLSHEKFFEKLVESAALPRTSLINEFRFGEAFEKLAADGSEVIAITLSSKLSGTYKSACKAAEKFAGRVKVVDSLNASAGERLLCEYAVRLREEGKSADEIVKELNAQKNRILVLAVLDTLLYLKKGGRISAMAAIAGAMLSVKPVIGVIGGEVKLVGKAMGSKKSNNLLNKLVEEKGIDFSMPHCVIWSGLDDSLMKKYVADSAALWQEHISEVPAHMIGSTIGTHIGPGAVGVAFFAK
ncbi:MAG: DegV family protein [Clostridia bacterium]|nr:DegV family protein [Clostridia bacterium]